MGLTPAARAAWKKRGAPLRPSRSTRASEVRPTSAARSTRSSGRDEARRNENAEAALSSTRMAGPVPSFAFISLSGKSTGSKDERGPATGGLLLQDGGRHGRARGQDDAHA